MAEIHLPTKVTQDSIKQDISEILGQFPISGGTDFFDAVSLSTASHKSGGTLYTTLDIQGKGIITSIFNSGSSSTDSIRISIDGGASEVIAIGSRSNINMFVPFHTSVTITQSASVTEDTIIVRYLLM